MLAAGALALSGCAGFGGGGDGDDSGELGARSPSPRGASESEETSFKALIKQFEGEHDGVKVKLNVVPYDQMFSNIDAQLSSGDAPDVFRVDYGNLGVYSSQDQLLDLSSYFTDDEVKAFVPAMWEAVSYDGKPYGVPHQTDVSALLVNTDMLKAAGIDPSTLPDHAGRRVDVGGVRGRRDQAARGAARRQVPVRLQLAAGRRAALAELAVPGRRHVPRGRRHDADDRLGRGREGARLHEELLREQVGAADQLDQGARSTPTTCSPKARPRWPSSARSSCPTWTPQQVRVDERSRCP